MISYAPEPLHVRLSWPIHVRLRKYRIAKARAEWEARGAPILERPYVKTAGGYPVRHRRRTGEGS